MNTLNIYKNIYSEPKRKCLIVVNTWARVSDHNVMTNKRKKSQTPGYFKRQSFKALRDCT